MILWAAAAKPLKQSRLTLSGAQIDSAVLLLLNVEAMLFASGGRNMKYKPRMTLQLLTVALALLCAVLAATVIALRPASAPFVLAALVLYAGLFWLLRARLRRWVAQWVTGGSVDAPSTKFSLEELSQPVLLLAGDTVVWHNACFGRQLLNGQPVPLEKVNHILPGLDLKACTAEEGQLVHAADHVWHVHAAMMPDKAGSMTLLVLSQETDLRAVEKEYKASRPGYLVFSIDGYDDVFGDMLDSERAKLLEGVNRVLETMIGQSSGFLRRVSTGRYIAVVEERHLEQFANRRYDVLDKIRALDPSVNLSVSIGIGRGARTLHEAQDMAVRALDMAQGRGGDQAAEMTPDGFTFYGGVSHGVEKRSKVRSRFVAEALVELIRQADHVVIMGHRMSDLDAIGAAEGVLRICKICDVPAVIAVRREATLAASLIDAFIAAGQGNDFIAPEQALPIISQSTLCIVVDTYQVGLVESKDILEKCGKVAVIDHHRKGVGFIEHPALVCHEPYASSASELVTELLQYVGERETKPTRLEAEGLLAGIMLDTRNFSLHTGVRTFEAAAALRRYGAETERVKSFFNISLTEYNAKSQLVAAARMYKNCAVAVSGELPPDARVAVPQAANDLLTILGVEASFVAVKVGNGVNISARSMGGVNVQVVMEALGGGGHQTMAAAQLKNIDPEAARARIYAAIDLYRAAQSDGTPHPGTRA
jgi:c-di-AMP phosphodiesterase-like protein